MEEWVDLNLWHIKEYDETIDLVENRDLYDRFNEEVWNEVCATAGDWVRIETDDEGWDIFVDKITIEDEDEEVEYTIYIEGEHHPEGGMYIAPYGERDDLF